MLPPRVPVPTQTRRRDFFKLGAPRVPGTVATLTFWLLGQETNL